LACSAADRSSSGTAGAAVYLDVIALAVSFTTQFRDRCAIGQTRPHNQFFSFTPGADACLRNELATVPS
jgi:hypothetical protein